MDISIIKTDSPDGPAAVAALKDTLRKGELTAGGSELDVRTIVRDIIADVETGRDSAAAALTSRFDQAQITPETIRVPQEQILAAHQAADEEFLQLVRRVADNIRRYQESILITDPPPLKREGRSLGVRYSPMARAGVYVPGGKAIYPSTVLMTIVPAQVAGVEQIAIASPPTGGDVNQMVLALAGELGVREVYRLGGAVAIAALALGTETISPVDKIVGPGNAFVAEAKRQLFGRVGIDSVAGPSEVLIVADQTARADYLAADMLAQAEHYPGSAILVTPSKELAGAVTSELDAQLPALSRGEEARACLEAYSAIIVTSDIDEACRIADDFATEHLQIITEDDQAALAKIRNAGAVFLGAYTPVPLGDYYAGPSHVLPTGGTAKFSGPLSCNDFLTAASILSYDSESLECDAGEVIDFATREGLTAHANAVRIRTKPPTQDK
ncbi:MAG: histidinol dehydrogenase [Phycisphaerae bacterium]|jgi:histidinol dehydrogenase|nr:histidinol dehydrogenase [Phycisphaerae bacterium]